MEFTREDADFSTYAFEDFLQNEFFIQSINFPSGETMLFWQDFERSTPPNLDEFYSAKEYLEAFKKQDEPLLSKKEMTDLWGRINKSNNARLKLLHYRIIRWSAVACIAVLLGSFFFMNFPRKMKWDVVMYAFQTKAELPCTDGEVLLVLSEDETVVIQDWESSITYDGEDIKVGKETISKNIKDNYNQLFVPRGKRAALTFSDGSKIWVNSGTRVVYPSQFDKKQREIYVDGEAYLEVFKDADRPFFVKTRDLNVRVLGTKFNVMAYEFEAFSQVVLAEGKVQVQSADNNAIILLPNSKYEVQDGADAVREVDAEKYISWIYGFYSFDSASFGFVIKRLSMYYGVDIEVDPALEEVKCSGKIDLKNQLETVFKGLDFIIPISYGYNATSSTYYINAR